ncbi:MAG: glycosyltransferase family 4 protein [Planctomycetota bacterium]|nr:glycosyltransferase family 4 protein [Planctomycetota bacterium]
MTDLQAGTNTSPRVLVAQVGARMHYAVPAILHSAGRLEALYTDFYADKWPWRALGAVGMPAVLPRKARILFARKGRLPARKVRAFQRFGLKYIWRYKTAQPQQVWKVNLWAGAEFNRLVIEAGLGEANCVYGIWCASLPLFEHAAGRGLKCVLDQCTCPAVVEDELVRQEYSRWSGWQEPPVPRRVEAYTERERAEWRLADTILCPSEFVKRGVQKVAGPVEKCRVVPYGVGLKGPMPLRKPPAKPVKILFVGQVRLLKGVPYLLDAMRQFNDGQAVCRIVGPVKVSAAKLRQHMPDNVSLIGPIPRTEMDAQYDWADIFCLPSLSEGSATVVYEAIVRGLPVITTANSGSIIDCANPGRNVIVPIRDADAIAEAIRTIAANWQPASDSPQAAALAQAASFEAYSDRLIAALAAAVVPEG